MSKSTLRGAGCSGFTLVEVLIASSVMLVGVLGMFATFVQALDGSMGACHAGVLNQLAAEKMEQLLALDYAHGDLTTGTHPSQANHPLGDKYYPASGYPSQYSVRWIVSAGPTGSAGTATANMKTLVIEATWLTRYTSGGAAILADDSRSVVMRTFLAQ